MYDLIVANECRNTHHKLVMNALNRLDCPRADDWRNLFVRYFELYLEGSKDPDTRFKDFRNHVLHVSDNYWGGAVAKVKEWYAVTVDHFSNERWSDAVYSAGVMSHYYMDPIMPLHTGQTEEEGVIHRACEWSVNKSFDQLIEQLEQTTGYPKVNLPTGNDWLKTTVHQGAELAHKHYQTFIDHYDFKNGSKNPPAGLDDRLKEITGQLLGYASVGFARILEKAISESGAQPARKSTSLFNVLYRVTAPVSWGFKAFCHIRNRGQVNRVAAEFRNTGKVIKALSPDNKKIRKLHAEEILQVDIEELDQQEIGPVGSKVSPAQEQGEPPRQNTRSKKRNTSSQADDSTPVFQPVDLPAPTQRKNGVMPRPGKKRKTTFRLELESPLEKAPSIGPKTSARFEESGIDTVGEFLGADPETTALTLNTRHITATAIRLWQVQARLACQIPGIYGHDAQILAGCGFESASEVADSTPELVVALVNEYALTEEARFIIRDGKVPDVAEVTNWIGWAKQARKLAAA